MVVAFRLEVEKETPTVHPSGIATGEVYCGCGEGVLGERSRVLWCPSYLRGCCCWETGGFH
jgi:hypothetical protein